MGKTPHRPSRRNRQKSMITTLRVMHIERIEKTVDLLLEPMSQSYNSVSMLDDQAEFDS
jgi:hypothetical protein